MNRFFYLRLSMASDYVVYFRIEAPANLAASEVIQSVLEYEGGWLHGERGVNAHGVYPTTYASDSIVWSDMSVNVSHCAVIELVGSSDPFEPDEEPELVSGNPEEVEHRSEENVPADEISLQEFITEIALEAKPSADRVSDKELEQLRGIARTAIAEHVQMAWGK